MENVFNVEMEVKNESISYLVKLSFSEKAKKMCAIAFKVLKFKRQNHEEDFANFCGLIRKAELYYDLVI
jgi:hypothetical protein